MAPVFLYISRKLLSSLLAEQHGVYCHSLPGLCVRKYGNRVVVVQPPIGNENFFAIHWLGTLPTCQCHLYGSRREMPTSLMNCIVHFFIFCWELLVMMQVTRWGVTSGRGVASRWGVASGWGVASRWGDASGWSDAFWMTPQCNIWYSDNSNGGSYWQVLLSGATVKSIQDSKPRVPTTEEVDLSTYLASVLLTIYHPFAFTQPPFSLPFPPEPTPLASILAEQV